MAHSRIPKDRLNSLKSRLLGPSAAKAATAGRVERVQIKLGSVTVHAKTLGIAAGRIALPKMVQGSKNLEDAFLVRNVKNPSAPEVLVINAAALDQELRRGRPARTLGDIVDALPFGRKGVPSLKMRPLPDGGISKRLRLPVRTPDREHESSSSDTPPRAQKR